MLSIPTAHHALSHPFSDMCKGFLAKSVFPLSHHCFSNSIISSNNEGKNEATLFVTDLTLHGRVLEPSRCLGTVDVWVRIQKTRDNPGEHGTCLNLLHSELMSIFLFPHLIP